MFERAETAPARKQSAGGGQKMSRAGRDDDPRPGDRPAERLTRGSRSHENAEREQPRYCHFGGGGDLAALRVAGGEIAMPSVFAACPGREQVWAG
jgi:hypothetical protein